MADELDPPLRGEPLFDNQGNITIRFAEFLDRLSIEVNTSVDQEDIDSLDLIVGARIAKLQAQIGSGNPLTSDETGFTVDLTTLSVDMTEA